MKFFSLMVLLICSFSVCGVTVTSIDLYSLDSNVLPLGNIIFPISKNRVVLNAEQGPGMKNVFKGNSYFATIKASEVGHGIDEGVKLSYFYYNKSDISHFVIPQNVTISRTNGSGELFLYDLVLPVKNLETAELNGLAIKGSYLELGSSKKEKLIRGKVSSIEKLEALIKHEVKEGIFSAADVAKKTSKESKSFDKTVLFIGDYTYLEVSNDSFVRFKKYVGEAGKWIKNSSMTFIYEEGLKTFLIIIYENDVKKYEILEDKGC